MIEVVNKVNSLRILFYFKKFLDLHDFPCLYSLIDIQSCQRDIQLVGDGCIDGVRSSHAIVRCQFGRCLDDGLFRFD